MTRKRELRMDKSAEKERKVAENKRAFNLVSKAMKMISRESGERRYREKICECFFRLVDESAGESPFDAGEFVDASGDLRRRPAFFPADRRRLSRRAKRLQRQILLS